MADTGVARQAGILEEARQQAAIRSNGKATMMRVPLPKYMLLASCMLIAGCMSLGHRRAPELRHDGIYQSNRIPDGDDPYFYYLRFYPDGTVIDTSSTGEPADLRPWFDRGMDDLSVGHVTVHGSHVAFSQTSKYGTVDYQGTIVGNTLQLASYSHINGHRDSRVFTFVKWTPAARDEAASENGQP